jgi:hypothetical protein
MGRTVAPRPPRAPLLEEARDELFSHILRSGVIGAPIAEQREWLEVTIAYLAARYPELSAELLDILRYGAERFCVRRPARA